MARYIQDPFTNTIVDSGRGAHDLTELRILITRILKQGMSCGDLITLMMESFGITAAEAKNLLHQALGRDREEPEPEPEDDYENGPSPF